MSDLETPSLDNAPADGQKKAQWRELRDLIAGPEQRRIDDLAARLDDPVRKAKEISQALPDALSMSQARDGRLARALQPAIDVALKRSVEKNPKTIADAIFPILGPAIRKAISVTMLRMVQSLNQILNQSFSAKGLRWRLQAWRTRTPFAEVVLLHTLVYRVEQIFLIHRRTGIVLAQAVADRGDMRDPDLISGMLTAIQDFVSDSFDRQGGQQLDTLRMDGNHSVWIEHGGEAFLAVVVRGTPPMSLRERFQGLIDEIHTLYANQWADFKGDIAPFAMLTPRLEDALTLQVRDKPKRISPLLWVGLGGLLLLVGILAAASVQQNRRWQAYLSRLRDEPGLVVLDAQRRNGGYYLVGLRDPLAEDPLQLTDVSGIDPKHIQGNWQRYYALDDDFTKKRVLNALEPPEGVTIQVVDGQLTVSGEADHAWVAKLNRRALTVAGVERLEAGGLTDRQMISLSSLMDRLKQTVIYFDKGRAEPNIDQKKNLDETVQLLTQGQDLQRRMGVRMRVLIVGHADPLGGKALNIRLSLARAQWVRDHLIKNGIDPYGLLAVGDPEEAEAATGKALDALRTVTFDVHVGQEPAL